MLRAVGRGRYVLVICLTLGLGIRGEGLSGVGLTEPSPPSHVRSTDCPAVILAGGFVNAIMVL